MQLVSVLCIPVSTIPTSLSFLKSFCPCVCICDLSHENVAYAIFLEMHFIMHSCRAIFALFIATYRVKIGQSVAKLLPI